MHAAILYYINSFKGLRKEVWWLAFVTFINRAGTMVIPFLSLYLKEDLKFSLNSIGWVMTAFGVGSVVGTWLGGKLTDKYGFYPIMFWSLFVSGFFFVALQYIKTFTGFCFGVFALMIISDTFRPAAYVAINTYSKPENKTRSVTLIRLAINLGFSLGPAVGGLIIAGMGYSGLFWLDGLTCFMAGLIFISLLKKKNVVIENRKKVIKNRRSPYTDLPYLLFLLIVLLIGTVFLQLFSTIPIYFSDFYLLSEKKIGFLMAANGIIIFILEMPLVKYLENPKFSIYKILFYSSLILASSFFIYNLSSWKGLVIIGMLLITIGEMINFPFLNRFALDRSQLGNTGEYMALFTIAFSFGHIIGHNSGFQLIKHFGFEITWFVMTGLLLIASILILWLKKIVLIRD